MMTLVLKLMKSKFAAAGAVLIIALIVILMGPRVGIYPPYNYLLGAFVLLCYVVWLIIKKLQAKKNASALEGFLNQQADDQLLTARPDVKDEIAALKEKMEHAVKILKQSKLGKGRRGSDALYVLPWYMLIGPSACGKSTAIRNSGLSFPPIDPDSEDPGKVKGLGGTRNCDWWFTNEGIILDTAGRYTISVDSAEDREEWSAFLGLLKKFRKKSPLNGLLAMVSVDELLQQSDDGIEAHAKNIRQRIDELIVKLEIIFPIYLVFTKCDLFSGFVEFFGDLSKREREQVWGYTCRYNPERTTLAHEEFRREFEKLFTALKARRMRKLQGDLRPGDEKKVYLFPLEFDAARRKMTAFIEALLQPNPFQQNPALRGVYFTSGTQEGTPIGQVMGSMAQEFNIPEDIGMILEPPKEPKAYFIKDLFSKIIMPDQAAVRPTAGSAKRGKWVRIALAAGITIATLLLVAALGFSYLNNTNLLAKTEREAETLKDVSDERPAVHIPDLEKLNEALDHLHKLDLYREDGPPLRLRWGLYKGETVNRAARRVLLGKITGLLMQPTVQKFERYLDITQLEEIEEAIERYIDVGNLYIMLTGPLDSALLDVGTLVEETSLVWKRLDDEDWNYEFEDLSEPLIRYWWRHRTGSEMQGVILARNQEVFRRVSQVIAEHMDERYYYRMIIDEANSEVEEFTVDDAVSGTIITGERSVRGAYTKVGWENQVYGLIKGSREKIDQVPLLKAALTHLDGIEEKLRDMYIRDYKQAWQDFFGGLGISYFADISEAVNGLDELSGEDSPIIELLNQVADNSEIEWDGERIEDVYRDFSGIIKFLGRQSGLKEDDKESSRRQERYFKNLIKASEKLAEDGGELEKAEGCGKSYGRLAKTLGAERKKAERHIPSDGSGLSRKAGELLGKPFGAALSAAYGEACDCLNEAWNTMVFTRFQEELGSYYPFVAHGSDAPLTGIVTFFGGSGSGIGQFDQQEAQPAKKAGIDLTSGYSNAVTIAGRIDDVISGGALKLRFTLSAESPRFKDVERAILKLGEKSTEYVMGGRRDFEFVWPSLGCDLSIIPESGPQIAPLRESGDWALFRMLDRATISENVITWTFPGSTCRAGYALSGPAASFIQARYFQRFSCPAKICGQ